MSEDAIAEIRGIDIGQELEPDLVNIMEQQ